MQTVFCRWSSAHLSFGTDAVGCDWPYLSTAGSIVTPVAHHLAAMSNTRRGRGLRGRREAQPVCVRQVVHQRMQEADAAYCGQPVHQHPSEAAVLHLGMHMLGQLAVPLVDKVQRLSPASLADFRQFERV
jgi:hypothetical protein